MAISDKVKAKGEGSGALPDPALPCRDGRQAGAVTANRSPGAGENKLNPNNHRVKCPLDKLYKKVIH
jgi:hypothetical protein